MNPLYDTIGSVYGATRRADPAIAATLARLAGVESGGTFLDLACGTGNYTCALAGFGGQWHGIDISEEMLRQARPKNPQIAWKRGSADALPYEDNVFDGVICTLAIHHFPSLDTPFREVFRVMNRGAFVLFTPLPEQMRNYWLWHYFPEMMERSTEQIPARDAVLGVLSDAGFAIEEVVPFHVTPDLQDLFLYAGKQRPELYLDPVVRANISSFAAFSSEAEVDRGLQMLRDDLKNGTFQAVAERYDGKDGDYAFVVVRK